MAISPRFIFSQYVRFWRDAFFATRIRKRVDRTKSIKRGEVLLLACHDSWDDSLSHFCDYYRAIGVRHFLFIDHGKNQDCARIAGDMADVSVFSASGRYGRTGNGHAWRNVILKRHAQHNFCVLANPGEYLVFPYMENRTLGELANFLKNERRDSLHGVVIDAYAGDLQDLPERGAPAGDPFAICPFIDRDGYYQRNIGESVASVIGGPSLRLSSNPYPSNAPVINRVVGVWWKWHYQLQRDGRTLRPPKLMRIFDWRNPVISAALFRFPQLEARNRDIPIEKMNRLYGREMAKALATDRNFHKEGLSVRHQSSADLIEIGLMSPGNWI